MPTIAESACRRAYIRWSRAAGPFWAYAGLTPLCGPGPVVTGHTPDATALARDARLLLDTQVIPLLADGPGRIALILDLPLHLSLACSAPLGEFELLTVPLVCRWPVEPSSVPAGPAAALLLAFAPARPRLEAATGVALLLDAERYGGSAPFRPEHFDGRYHYPIDVLPPPGALLDWGATAVVTVSDRAQLRDDLLPIVERYASAGLRRADVWVDVAAASKGKGIA